MRLLIADDEAPLRDWLARLLAEVAPSAEIIASVADGDAALAAIETLKPDAALLDIRMPGLSGLEVAARLRVPCRIIFVTAYEEFAVQAFEQAAVDYLLKPVTAERLAKALERLPNAAPPAEALLDSLLARLGPAAARPLRWLRAAQGESVRLIDVAEVDRFEAADKYTTIHVGSQQWLIRTPLKELECQLDADAFWRVHRGTLVRVAAVREVRRDAMGRLWLEMRCGGAPLPVSRRRIDFVRCRHQYFQESDLSVSAIALRGISKHYHMGDEDILALKGIDLDVPTGAFVAVRGPSGSGKSTLLNVCGLVDSFDAGTYHLAGEDVGGLDETARTLIRRSRIGFVFQSYNLVPVMSVRDNVEYPLLLAERPPAERRERVDEILAQVGLTGLAERRPDQLSGGQRQRVAIARALVKSPTLVIADEPTANLDTATAQQVVDLMKLLGERHGATFLIATHDERMTAHCDQVRALTDGELQ